MNTIYAMMMVLFMADGTTQFEWPKTFTSLAECKQVGEVIYNRRVAQIEAKNPGIVRIEAGCVRQGGA